MRVKIIKVLSLFNGISCGRIALERANIPVERYVSYEIDKYANKVSKANYPDDEYNGDVFDADFTKYKGFDLLIGGSPCTNWSIAKNGRETTPNGIGWELFLQFKRALVESGCKWFLYENNHSIHKDIKTAITNELDVEPIMINSALVSAQNRRREYWTNIPNVVQPEDKGIFIKDILESGYVGDINKAYVLTATCGNSVPQDMIKSKRTQVFKPVRIGDISTSKAKGQSGRVYSINGKSVCLSANGGGGGAKTGLYKIDLTDGDYIIRKLFIEECCRLQTIPSSYFIDASGEKIVFDTQAYKGIGNGWTVDVIAWILSFIQL